jgi:hypothetical protein
LEARLLSIRALPSPDILLPFLWEALLEVLLLSLVALRATLAILLRHLRLKVLCPPPLMLVMPPRSKVTAGVRLS